MARIDYEKPEWIFRCTFEERHIPKKFRFFWSAEKKVWFTKDLSVVADAKSFLTLEAKKVFDSLSGLSVWPVVSPQDPRLYVYQTEGAEFLQRYSGTILADEPGVGKTAQSIAAIKASQTKKMALIVCPPFLAFNWEKEIAFWHPEARVQIFRNRKDEVARNIDFFILPDSHLTESLRPKFMCHDFDWAIVDEAHRFKTPGAKRTQSLFGLFDGKSFDKNSGLLSRAKRKVLLTGTPIPNRPIELWAQLSAVAPHAIDHMNYYQYAEHYCAGFRDEFGYNANGASNLDELSKRLNNVMLRRLKSDVLKELPSRTKSSLVIMPSAKELRALSYEKNLKDKIKASDYVNTDWTQTQNEVLGAFAKERRNLSLEKAERAVEWATNFLEGNPEEKILIFGWHTEAIEEIAASLSSFGSTTITGLTSMEHRHQRVHRFQNDKTLRVIVANIQAGGVGLTLTACSTVLFNEFSWVPSENDQAIDRLHRIGQSKPVTAYFLVYKNSIDEYIFEAQKTKQSTINKILGG